MEKLTSACIGFAFRVVDAACSYVGTVARTLLNFTTETVNFLRVLSSNVYSAAGVRDCNQSVIYHGIT
jgi:hypothetical protein